MKATFVLSVGNSVLAMVFITFQLLLYSPASIATLSETNYYHACYAPGSEISERTTHHQRYEYIGNRWQQTAIPAASYALGQPVTLTWSILPDGTTIAGGYGEPTSPSNLTARLLQLFPNEAAYMAMFDQALQGWINNVGVKFVYEPNDDGAGFGSLPGVRGVRGDIRIGGHYIDGNYGILAYTSAPDAGDMVIDTADIYFAQQIQWMFQAVAHEIGHALGLGHTCPMSSTKLMEPLLATTFEGPQFDDLLGAMQYYGDRYEPNNQLSVATSLGSLSNTGLSLSTVSLHSSSDIDFYSFTTGSSSSVVTVTVQPTAQDYQEGAVGSGGGTGPCGGTFPTYDRSRVYNLQLDIYDSSGDLLAYSNTGSLGVLESLTIQASPGQTYYVRVFTTSVAPSTENSVQMYSVGISSTIVTIAQSTSTSSPTPSRTPAPAASSSSTHSHTPVASSSPSHLASSSTPSHSPVPSNTPSPSHANASHCPTTFCVK